jgi:hypothetical protein
MIFKSNPAAALHKTRRKLADVEANITSLKVKRGELLATADADNIAEIQTLNKAIEAEESARTIYVDKVKALQEEVRKVTYAEREGQRAKQIEKIKERLQRRETLASELSLAIARVGRLYSAMLLDRTDPIMTRHDMRVEHEHRVTLSADDEALEQYKAMLALGVTKEKLREVFGGNYLPKLERLLEERTKTIEYKGTPDE